MQAVSCLLVTGQSDQELCVKTEFVEARSESQCLNNVNHLPTQCRMVQDSEIRMCLRNFGRTNSRCMPLRKGIRYYCLGVNLKLGMLQCIPEEQSLYELFIVGRLYIHMYSQQICFADGTTETELR